MKTAIISKLRAVYHALPVLHKFKVWIHEIPHSRHAPAQFYHFFTHTDPMLVVVGALGVFLAVALVRYHWWKLIVVAILISFATLLPIPHFPGRAVIHAANKLPLADRPLCIGAALGNGANWMPDLLPKVKVCKAPKQKVVVDTHKQVDTGNDGMLTGLMDGPHWTAQVKAPAPTNTWSADTEHDGLGNNIVYFVGGGDQYEVSYCPDDQGATPRRDVLDPTGVSYSTYLYKAASRADLARIVTGAVSLEKTKTAGVFRIVGLRGVTVGYILPASGAHGSCGILTGPYEQTVSGSLLLNARPSRRQQGMLAFFSSRTHIFGLKTTP